MAYSASPTIAGAPIADDAIGAIELLDHGSGSLVSIEQSVGHQGSGALVSIEQTIELQITASGGALVTIEQTVTNSGSGSLIAIEQRIADSTANLNITRYGWDLVLSVGGRLIDASEITGLISITRNENGAALMDITLLPSDGVQDLSVWHGLAITLDVVRTSGVNRLYTGVVDIPEFDLVNGRVTLRCTDKRNEQINAQMEDELQYLGYWSDAIFDEPDDVADELAQRLTTTTKTVDFDAYGQYTIADFLPKATADFTLANAGIFRRNPRLQVASRGRLVNRINIEFEYRYVRLRHRERDFELNGASFCDVIWYPDKKFLSVVNVQSALDYFSWPVDPDTIDFTYIPDAGWKTCYGVDFYWSPSSHSATVRYVRDEDGNIIYDSFGNPRTEVVDEVITDYSQAHATAASWTASYRFAQDISEKINIQVDAPQSQNQYGVIEKTQRNGHEVEYDASTFEKNETYTDDTGLTTSSGDSYIDMTGDLFDYLSALNTAVAIAETEIAKAHRDNHVYIETPLWPEIDLKHTVETTASIIQAKGKVSQISHTINIGVREAYSKVRFSLSQATGSQSAETLTLPLPSAALIGGYDTDTLVMDAEDGQFTSPPIDDESRNRQEVETDLTYNVPVRDDDLTVTFI